MLTPLEAIQVPAPRADETYTARLGQHSFRFQGLKRLLAAADLSKAGDRHAGLAATSELEREAARSTLAELSLGHLHDHPLVDDTGRIDCVMRVNYDIDVPLLASIADWTVGQFKDHLLRAPAAEILPLGRALTGPMAAAVAKLCDVHELILISQKLPRTSHARTTLGQPGTLASRLQPNHPTDDLRAITLLIYWGLSLGSGDALIGLNPAVDTLENVEATLRHLHKIRQSLDVPTQICVLSHIKTQLACLERGAPVEILFQSLAGTEATLTSEFDVTIDLLDRGYQAMRDRGPLRDLTRQMMYFETGQGSEFTYGKHQGIDMTTAEALCYGLARRYDPFMVNNVTGFIGPETHLDSFEMIYSNLQDHFMGKLLGLPMGMAPCYTLHSQILLEGQQMATQLLTAAGANYFMDVALNTDRMLAYFDTSGHDDQTLREVHQREPASEFSAWACQRGIFQRAADGRLQRGPTWGQPEQFCSAPGELQSLLAATPAIAGFESAGPRPANHVSRVTRGHQAQGREAMHSVLQVEALADVADFRVVATQAATQQEHLDRPDLGSRLAEEDAARLQAEDSDVQIVVSDGLNAAAVHQHVPSVMAVLQDALSARPLRVGQPLLVKHGRVKLAEPMARLLRTKLVVYLLGERPGGDAAAASSLSAYLVYQPPAPSAAEVPRDELRPRFEYTVISNIHAEGLPPLEAGAVIAEKVFQILDHHAAGHRLEQLLNPGSNSPDHPPLQA